MLQSRAMVRGEKGRWAHWRDDPATRRRFLVVYRMAEVQGIPAAEVAEALKLSRSQVYRIVEAVKRSGILDG